MPEAPPTPKGARGGSWLKTHKTEAYVGAAGIVVTIALYMRSKSSSTGATPTSYAVPAATAVGTGSFDGNPWGGTTPAPATSPQNLATAPGELSGGGFLPQGASAQDIGTNPGTDTARSSGGELFTWLNPQQYAGYTGPVYYEPVPGDFERAPVGLAGIAPNTPLYGQGGIPSTGGA